MTVQLPKRTSYANKDQRKADKANKFIGKGSARSSTHAYMLAYGELANCGGYSEDDVVFISSEGARNGRVNPPFAEIDLAIASNVTFITDDAYNRNRSYNIGERQVATYLTSKGYVDTLGVWIPLHKHKEKFK